MPIIEPPIHEVETAAFYCFQQGGGDGQPLKDWLQAKRLVFMEKNYDIIARHSLQNRATERLGNQGTRYCRYCRAIKPNAVEWEEAWALPELVGNATIVAMDECPVCNAIFNSLEVDLGTMLQVTRAIGRIEGKKGILPFIALNAGSRIDVMGDQSEMTERVDGPLSESDKKAETFATSDQSVSFTPLAVYKSLTKMALAVMPPAYLPKFRHTIDWIRKKNHAVGAAEVAGSAKCRFIFQPGPMPPDYYHCTLLVRKSPDALIPYMLFCLTMANQTFQIMVPQTPCDNHLVGQKFAMPEYPAYYGYGYKFGDPMGTTLDLAAPDRVRIEIGDNGWVER